MIAAFRDNAGLRMGMRHARALWRDHPWLVVRFGVSALGKSVMGVATVLVTKAFLAGAVGAMDRTGDGASATAASLGADLGLWTGAALIFLTILGSSLLSYDNRLTSQRMVQLLELDMMERMLRHLLALSVPYTDRQSPGDLLQAVGDDVGALRSVIFAVAAMVIAALSALGLFAAALWVSPKLTFWALVVLPLVALPVLIASREAKARSRTIRTASYVLLDTLLEMVEGMRVLKIYQGDETVVRTTMDRSRRYFRETIEMVRVKSYAQVLLELIAGSGVVLVVVVGGLDVIAGRMEWPALLAFLLAVRALYGPVNTLNNGVIALGSLKASTDRVTQLLATPPEVQDHPEARTLPEAPSTIAFEGVSFGYGEKQVLTDVSFAVRAGETIGIVGPSGAGKTTLLNLIARFYDPTAGTVRYDAHDLRTLRLDDVHARIGIVTQSSFLFAASVRENIRCARPAATDAEVEQAARAAGIHDEILGFAQGYDTVIGSGGTGVSGGQAQRINIARAVLKNPPILLLDEATASLDSRSELVVQQALDSLLGGRTSFVVAHRLSTLRGASRLLVLEQGRVAGFGTHADLLASCAVYRDLWALQQG